MSLSSSSSSDHHSTSTVPTRVPLLNSAVGGIVASDDGKRLPYAMWRNKIEVYLSNFGIKDADYKEEMTVEEWKMMERAAVVAKDDKEAELRRRVKQMAATKKSTSESGSASSSATAIKESASATTLSAAIDGTPQKVKSEFTDEEKSSFASMVTRATKAYNIIFNALPNDCITLVKDTIPKNFAYGLWIFLERRFQNTEHDSVADLLEQFNSLEQEKDEDFQMYRARVDAVRNLLTHAKEPISENQYMHRLIWKLQPKYHPVVLALKSAGKTKDATRIDWVEITQDMTQHERAMLRINGESERSMAARGVGKSSYEAKLPWKTVKNSSKKSKKDKTQYELDMEKGACFECHDVGHPRRDCPVLKEEREKRAKAGNSSFKQGEDTPRRAKPSAKRSGRRTPKHTSSSNDELSDEEGVPHQAKSAVRRDRGHGSATSHGVSLRNAYESLSESDSERESTDEDTDSESSVDTAKFESDEAEPHKQIHVARSYAALVHNAQGPILADLVHRSQQRAMAAAASPTKNQPLSQTDLNQGPNLILNQVQQSRRIKPMAKQATKSRQVKRSLSEDLATNSYGLDSMASVHCTGNKDSLYNIRPCTPIPVEVADGTIVPACFVGSVDLLIKVEGSHKPMRVKIDQVYYNERFSTNLLSACTLSRKGWSLVLKRQGAYLISPYDNRIKLRTEGRVLVLDSMPVERERACGAQAMRHGKITISSVKSLFNQHARLGHVNFARLLRICRKGMTDGIDGVSLTAEELKRAKELVDECPACVQGKGTRTPLGHRGLDRGRAPGEVLHMDSYYVKYKNASGNEVRVYGIAASDPNSEKQWTAWVPKKDLLPEEQISIIKNCQTTTGRKVKRIYTDSGSEYINRKFITWCKDNGIETHLTPTGVKELNGIAESKVKAHKDAVCTSLIHCGLPDRFWTHAALHHTFVWNRTRIGRVHGKTPMEVMTGTKPSIEHVGVFGCDTFVHVSKEKRSTTFSPKMVPGIYLGHDAKRNCATVLLLQDNKIVYSRDVVFKETSFTFAKALKRGRVHKVVGHQYTAAEILEMYSDHNDEGTATDDQNSDTDSESGIMETVTLRSRPTRSDEEMNSTISFNPRIETIAHAPEIVSDSDFEDAELQPESKEEHEMRMEHKYDEQELDTEVPHAIDHGHDQPEEIVDLGDDGDDRYEVDAIVGKRISTDGKVEYEVKWTGHKKTTWEPKDYLDRCDEAIAEYEETLVLKSTSPASNHGQPPAKAVPSSKSKKPSREEQLQAHLAKKEAIKKSVLKKNSGPKNLKQSAKAAQSREQLQSDTKSELMLSAADESLAELETLSASLAEVQANPAVIEDTAHQVIARTWAAVCAAKCL